MHRLLRRFVSCVAILASTTSALAHDFWIEPSTLRPAADERVQLVLRVGERLVGDEVPRKESRILRFELLAPNPGAAAPVASAVVGVDQRSPAGFVRPRTNGIHWVVYESSPIQIELLAPKFESYLKEEGLDHVLAARASTGASAKPGKEAYSRCVKALLPVGDAARVDADVARKDVERAAGLTLEIQPEGDWTRATAGEPLRARVLFRGAPLANALVGCVCAAEPDAAQRSRSDELGRVTFKPERAGMTLVRVVHMIEASAEVAKEHGAEWQSFWASVVFDLAPRTTPIAK